MVLTGINRQAESSSRCLIGSSYHKQVKAECRLREKDEASRHAKSCGETCTLVMRNVDENVALRPGVKVAYRVLFLICFLSRSS